MAERIAICLIDGRLSQVPLGDTIRGSGGGAVDDFLSGHNIIAVGETKIIPFNKQSINFIQLQLDGILTLDGDLWLV